MQFTGADSTQYLQLLHRSATADLVLGSRRVCFSSGNLVAVLVMPACMLALHWPSVAPCFTLYTFSKASLKTLGNATRLPMMAVQHAQNVKKGSNVLDMQASACSWEAPWGCPKPTEWAQQI